MQSVQLIQASSQDAEMLRKTALLAFADDLERYGTMPPGIETLEWHLVKIESGMYYKILNENQIIGGLNIYILGEHHYRLGALFLSPAFHGQGIGRKAVELMEAAYPEATKWSLDTPYQNYRNHRFYEKLGFVKVDEVQPIEGLDFWLFEYVKE